FTVGCDGCCGATFVRSCPPRHASVMIRSSSASKPRVTFLRLLMDPPMAGKMLSTQPAIDPTASVRDCQFGAYTEVGARTILLEVTMADYSYVVNDAQITYTTIGKFCSIAAMTRINPGNHPMHRASQAHFT